MMLLDPIWITPAQLEAALTDVTALLKSRQRVCPDGLTSRLIVDRRGRKMTVCVREAPDHPDPLHHAKNTIAGMDHVIRYDGPAGHGYVATHGYPQKTTVGHKLDAHRHPAQFFEDDLHIVPIHPESHEAGHSPGEAYHHAMQKQIIRGADGEPYGVIAPYRRNPDGTLAEYVLLRSKKNQFNNRMSSRQSSDDRYTTANRGHGIVLRPAELSYLHDHPPRTGVEHDPTGHVFAYWSRIELPALDADGRPIATREPQVRYEVKLDPRLYGGDEALQGMHSRPLWKVVGDASRAESRFRRYLDGERRRLFSHLGNRPAGGKVGDLLAQHGGSVSGLLNSGDLGHHAVPETPAGAQKLQRYQARKPITAQEAVHLGLLWREQHPGVVDSIKHYVRSRFPSLIDDALLDNAIDEGLEAAIHRFDPERGDFNSYARRTITGRLYHAAMERGAAAGAERVAGGPRPSQLSSRSQDVRDEFEEASRMHDTPEAATTRPGQDRRDDAAYRKTGGSQSAFARVLEAALPDEPRAREVIAALFPTGDFSGPAAHFKRVSEQTGIPVEELMRYSPARERVRQHRAYQRYRDEHLRELEEQRQLQRSQQAGTLMKQVVAAIGTELRRSALRRAG